MNNKIGSKDDGEADKDIGENAFGLFGLFCIATTCRHYKGKAAENQKSHKNDTGDNQGVSEEESDKGRKRREGFTQGFRTPRSIFANINQGHIRDYSSKRDFENGGKYFSIEFG